MLYMLPLLEMNVNWNWTWKLDINLDDVSQWAAHVRFHGINFNSHSSLHNEIIKFIVLAINAQTRFDSRKWAYHNHSELIIISFIFLFLSLSSPLLFADAQSDTRSQFQSNCHFNNQSNDNEPCAN